MILNSESDTPILAIQHTLLEWPCRHVDEVDEVTDIVEGKPEDQVILLKVG